jgi:hypothetical protein
MSGMKLAADNLDAGTGPVGSPLASFGQIRRIVNQGVTA